MSSSSDVIDVCQLERSPRRSSCPEFRFGRTGSNPGGRKVYVLTKRSPKTRERRILPPGASRAMPQWGGVKWSPTKNRRLALKGSCRVAVDNPETQ
jgi:hypothetical protein